MENRIDIWKVLKNDKKLSKVIIFAAQEVINDPYEKTKDLIFRQSITIDALVRDVSPEALVWKYYGQIPMGSKELICQKKYKLTLLTADRIKVGDTYFKVRKDDSKGFAILERQDYIVCIVEQKIDA